MIGKTERCGNDTPDFCPNIQDNNRTETRFSIMVRNSSYRFVTGSQETGDWKENCGEKIPTQNSWFFVPDSSTGQFITFSFKEITF
jgi:hypothetical protein